MSKNVSGVTDQEPDSQDNNIISKRQSLIYRLKFIAHSQFPRLFPHTTDTLRLESYRTFDSEKNKQTTPPADELIDLSCVWVVEFYTPTHVDELLTNLKKLGWDSNERDFADPVAWISESRQHLFGGGWLNLGVIYSGTDGVPASFHHRTAPLPPNVQCATGGLYSITSSLICIVMGFVFEGDYCAQFDKALRTNRKTYTSPLTHGYRIHGPENQKIDHICQIRDEMIGLATDWFQKHLPGLFSSGLLGGKLPTCEFVTLHKAEPFAPREDDGPSSYLFILDLYSDWNVWRSATGLKFKAPSLSTSDRHPYHAILAVRESDLDEDEFKTSGERDRRSLCLYIDEVINSLLSRWAILPMLEGYNRHLSAIRDSDTLRSNRRLNRIKTLKTLIDHVSYTVDIAAITTELIPYAKNSSLFFDDVGTFEPCDDRDYKAEATLIKGIGFTIGERATWLQKTEQSLRDHLAQYGSLLGAMENIHLQKRLKLLTWIIIGMTLVLLVQSDNGSIVSHIWDWIRDRWEHF